MNAFELAFLGLVMFDCRDEQLVEDTKQSVFKDKGLEGVNEVTRLYEDMRPWMFKGHDIRLVHWLSDDDCGAYLYIDTGSLNIRFLNPDEIESWDDIKTYTKDEAWAKMELWASMGPWDLLKPIEDKPELQCKAMVKTYHDVHSRRCERRATGGGYCWQHKTTRNEDEN